MAAQMDQTVKNSPSAISSGFGTSDSLGKSHYRPVRPNSCNTILGNPDGKNSFGLFLLSLRKFLYENV